MSSTNRFPITSQSRVYAIPITADVVYFQVDPPFTPDVIESQCAIAVEQEGKTELYEIMPIYSGTGTYNYPYMDYANIFSFESSLVGTSILGLCNASNSFNPEETWINSSKLPCAGRYDLRVRNTMNNAPVTQGTAIVKLNFIKMNQ